MRNRFDQELDQLNALLTEMGALIESAIDNACRALMTHDEALACSVFSGDVYINQIERQIESLCLRLLLQQQPVARDLRLISAALKMITDMERVGDQAQDIAEIVPFLADGLRQRAPAHVEAMANATIDMVHKSVDAFVQRDLSAAQAVIASDDVVDALFSTVKGDLVEMIVADPQSGEFALDLLMVAKYFERIGDHAVNIAEWVEFAMTGLYKGAKLP